jgi:hypothetical protein
MRIAEGTVCTVLYFLQRAAHHPASFIHHMGVIHCSKIYDSYYTFGLKNLDFFYIIFYIALCLLNLKKR